MGARIHDNIFRWLITSKSRPGEHHLVDISAHRGHGECSCEDWQMVRSKRIKMMEPRSIRTRCKHITEAREAFSVWCIDRLVDPSISPAEAEVFNHALNMIYQSATKRRSVPDTP